MSNARNVSRKMGAASERFIGGILKMQNNDD